MPYLHGGQGLGRRCMSCNRYIVETPSFHLTRPIIYLVAYGQSDVERITLFAWLYLLLWNDDSDHVTQDLSKSTLIGILSLMRFLPSDDFIYASPVTG